MRCDTVVLVPFAVSVAGSARRYVCQLYLFPNCYPGIVTHLI